VKSLADVARLAGVSKATASRALNSTGYVSESTREKVAAAAAELGYVASTNAASLVTGRTRNVAVVTPYINRWFFAEVIDGIEEALLAAGYDLTLYRLRGSAEQRNRVFDYFLVRKRVDAVIAVGMELEQPDLLPLTSLRKPLVAVGGELDGIPTVRLDDVAAAALATRHLVDLGHTRLVHLGGRLDGEHAFGVHGKRLHGFRSIAGARSADSRYVAAAMTVEAGHAAALTLLASDDRPTGIVAACDELAIGALVAARTLGIEVPRDLSVVGIDDHPLAELFELTTVRQVPSEQGSMAVALILELLAGADPAGRAEFDLPVELVVRGSTTSVPASPHAAP
jgi:LacI family repressor for deo operon, udp, cdd, tsx, nupC, and nupG